MKEVTRYVAEDGREFVSAAECQQYEADGCVEFRPIPDYGEHVPITDEDLAWMIGGDGSCYYATADRVSAQYASTPPHPKWATHLMYFGK